MARGFGVPIHFAANFADHGEVGGSLAVMVDGDMVVDLWGGYADGAGTRQWEQDTITNRRMAYNHYFGPNAKKKT